MHLGVGLSANGGRGEQGQRVGLVPVLELGRKVYAQHVTDHAGHAESDGAPLEVAAPLMHIQACPPRLCLRASLIMCDQRVVQCLCLSLLTLNVLEYTARTCATARARHVQLHLMLRSYSPDTEPEPASVMLQIPTLAS